MRSLSSLLLLGTVVSVSASAVAGADVDQSLATRRVQAHTLFLSDDLMEGRGTGTRGYDMAARYVASQFARIGLESGANTDDFQQPVALRESAVNFEAGRLVAKFDGREETFAPVTEALISPTAGTTQAEITAPAVFVGFGVRSSKHGYDDFAHVDLKGKIAVVLSGAPAGFPSEERAHHSAGLEKAALLVKHGAVGVVTIISPRDAARRPWNLTVAFSRFPGMRLLDETGAVVDGFPQLKVSASLPHPAGARLFAASGQSFDEVWAKAQRGEAQSLPLNVELTLSGEATVRPIESANVLGWLPGSDPALARQPIVITGHLDHLGIGPAVNGDTIYNGAMDNAIGIGLILAIAEELAQGPKLARPVMFAALTAEEKGLLGAHALARHPPKRVDHFAANINIDMTLFMAPVRDIVAWGAEHSTLGASTNQAAQRTGFTVSPDWMPDETIFVRSDQYPFVRMGVPAIYLGTGQNSVNGKGDLAAAWNTWLRERYHKPSDDLNQPIDWPSVGAYAALITELTRDIANDRQAPAWLPGDFFGELFAPNAEKNGVAK